jgi:CheY-like chemotaxis protein
MKALVVEDDPTIVEMVEDVLFSLGHEFEVATNQQDAQQLLKSMDFDYVLLDLQIPAKANRGGADKQYGINLLKDIQRMKAPSPPPVIMMTAHLADGFNLSSELQRNGVRECIAKPFSDAARPLSSVILAVVGEYGPKAKTIETPKPVPIVVKEPLPERRRFDGGELVFETGRITLCGTTILLRTRSKLKWRIREVLNRHDLNGKWIGISGPEIAEILGLRSGQNGVSGAIRDFRTSICKILSAELGLICDQDDVIRSGGPGYRLNEWIRIEDGSQSKTQTVEDEGQSRRDRILELLAGGKRLRTAAIAESLGCSQATAKRELDFLRSTGAIEFIGPSKTGGYQLRLVMSE